MPVTGQTTASSPTVDPREVAAAIVGQAEAVRGVMISLILGGHALLAVPPEGPVVDRVQELLDQGQICHDTSVARYRC